MCALRIAVTGTAGRLGGSIARACRAAGQEVAATLDRAPGADVSHVADLSADGRHTWASAFEGVDVVIHAAALPGPAREPPPTVDARRRRGRGRHRPRGRGAVRALRANVASTLNVLDAAARAGVRRVVLSSSAFAMGWSHGALFAGAPAAPRRRRAAPRESYGLSKEVGDAVGAAYARACGLEVASLRFTNVVKRDAFRACPGPTARSSSPASDVGGLPLDGGGALPGGATLAYRVYGDRSGPRVAVHLSSFGAVHAELAYNVPLLLEHADAVLVANMLGNGVSSSPSTCAAYPPVVTVDDQARALRRACDAAFGRGGPSAPPRLLHGRHAGAGARARGGVAAVVAVCGAAGCSDYNRVFLDALDAALEGGDRARRSRARHAAGASYDFYAERAWARLGFEDLDDFLERSYVAGFATDDPDDLRAMLACWRAGDRRAYFRADEIERREVAAIPGATLRPIRSPFGHRAGDPWRDGMDAERAFIRAEVRAFLGNS
ncbi:alpha/beta hydrolase [Aureococcus anophagefferens]|nr:alpha/beta hydrolase [Aureococcus anophagefferens]